MKRVTRPVAALVVGVALAWNVPAAMGQDATSGPAAQPAVSIAIGCDAFAARPDAVASFGLGVGVTVAVSLCSNPSTGFEWTDAVSSDPAVAAVGDQAYEPPADDQGMAGVAGTQHLTVTANAAGTAVIAASYDRPWEGGEKGVWTLELTIVVE
jgi:inhibitor of cysteine peptidase